MSDNTIRDDILSMMLTQFEEINESLKKILNNINYLVEAYEALHVRETD